MNSKDNEGRFYLSWLPYKNRDKMSISFVQTFYNLLKVFRCIDQCTIRFKIRTKRDLCFEILR